MGAYCLLESVPSHRASVGEILEVHWFDYYGAVIFGDRNEIACIPHEGCRLEITATAPSPHRKAELLLPGQCHPIHAFVLPRRSIRAAQWPQSEAPAPSGVQTAAHVGARSLRR